MFCDNNRRPRGLLARSVRMSECRIPVTKQKLAWMSEIERWVVSVVQFLPAMRKLADLERNDVPSSSV